MEIKKIVYLYYMLVCFLESNSFIVSKIGIDSISMYYKELKYHTNDNIGSQFKTVELFSFCHILRLSKVFHIGNNSTVHPNYAHFFIPQTELQIEKELLKVQIAPVLVKKSKSVEWLPSFRCLDHTGVMRWLITKAFMPSSYFLFQIEPNFKYIYSREIRDNHMLLPQLTAVIDPYPHHTRISGYQGWAKTVYLMEKYMDSNMHSNESIIDPLCNLPDLFQYRLCAITSSAIVSTNPRHSLAEDYSSTSQTYPDLTFNLYFQSKNREIRCQAPKVTVPPVIPTPLTIQRLLHCPVLLTNASMQRETREFYVALNKQNTELIFIFENQPYHNITIVEERRVHFLRHVIL